MKRILSLFVSVLCAVCAWAQNMENGHEYVDLGLTSGTMWATTNIGADTPEAIGDYFAWGETATKETRSWETYTLCDGDYDQLTKYIPAGWDVYGKDDVTDDKSVLEKADDVASQTWQGNWAIPTPDQLNELVTECCWLYTNTYKGNSVAGYIIYKAKNEGDKGAFYVYQLPPTGYTTEDTHIFLPVNCGDFCHYWSNTVAENNPAMAVAFSFVSNDIPKIKQEVRDGSTKVSVRPVYKAPIAEITTDEGTTKYTDVDEFLTAFLNITSEASVKLLSDITLPDEIQILNSSPTSVIIFDFNGHNINGNVFNGSLFDLNIGNFTINGEGIVNNISGLSASFGVAGTVVVNGGTYSGTLGLCYVFVEGEMTIYGGKFGGSKLYYIYSEEVHHKPIVKGGIFSMDPSDCVAEGYVSVANDDEDTKADYPYKVVEKSLIPTAIDAVNADKAGKAIKTIENGKVVIIRNGEKYDLAGRKL